MPKRLALFAWILVAGLVCLLAQSSLAQTSFGPPTGSSTGPSVQLFTALNPDASGSRLLPFDRPLYVDVSLLGGYDDNVNTSSSNEVSSLYGTLGLVLRYAFGTERTQATLSTNARVAYYAHGRQSGDPEYRPDVALTLGVTHGVSERLTLSGSASLKYSIEPDLSITGSLNRPRGTFLYTAESLSATYLLLERWSTHSSFSFSTFTYEDPAVGANQDRVEEGFNQEVRFLLLPVTTAVAEYRLALVQYDLANRDSTTHSILFGVNQTIGPHVSGSLRVGAQFRSTAQGEKTAINPYADTTLSCVFGERTTFRFNARYSTEEPDFVNSPSRQTFRTGLAVTYGLTPRIGSSVSIYYRHDSNGGNSSEFSTRSGFTEDAIDIALSLSYAITPRISTNAGFNRTEVFSDREGRSYSRDRYFAGVRVSF